MHINCAIAHSSHRSPGMDDTQQSLAQIAAMYYEQGLTQNGIADQLGLSRVKVYRLLKQATTMAVCLGRSTYEVINAMRPGFQAQVRVAQAIGSMPFAMRELDSAA